MCDMEEFIYSLYNRYQIQLTFDIPYQGKCTCTVGKSNIGEIKIGNNTNAIVDISPITEVEETNRLIIYNEDGTYRPYFSDKWVKRLTELGYDSHLKEDLERFIKDGEKNIRKSLYEIDIKDRRQGRIGD